MEHRKMTVSNCNDWATHSPGPWEHRDGKVYGGGGLVATLDPAMIEEEVAMKEADARLIAASPSLLLALQAMLHRFEDHEQYPDGGDESLHATDAAVISMARAAIAKAEGGEA